MWDSLDRFFVSGHQRLCVQLIIANVLILLKKKHVKMYNYPEEIIISYSRVLQFATTGRQTRKI